MLNTYQKIKILTSIEETNKQSKAWRQILLSADTNLGQKHITQIKQGNKSNKARIRVSVSMLVYT